MTPEPSRNPRPPGLEHPLSIALLFLVLWQVLLRSQNPGLNTDDSGEIAAAARGLGICHGPGYPLYSLMGRLFSLLPLGTVSFRLNLMASLFTLAAALLIADIGRVLIARAGDANPHPPTRTLHAGLAVLSAVLSLVFCRSVFAQSLTSKGGLYLFHLAGLAALLRAGLGGPVRVRSLGMLFLWAVGLGAHWQTQLLWGLLLVLRFRQLGVRWSVRRTLFGASFALLGVSSLLYLPLRAHLSPALNHFDPERLGSFLALVLRTDTPGHDFILTDPSAYGRLLLKYGEVLFWHWWPGFIPLAAIGALVLFRRDRPQAWAWTIQYALVVGLVVLASFFNDPRGIYLFGNIIVSTQGVPAVLGSLGLAAVADRVGRTRAWASPLLLTTVLLGTVAWGFMVSRELDKSRYTLADDYGLNLLRELPRGSLLLSDDDLSVMPAHYYQGILGMRPDVAWIPLYKLHSDWGRRDLAARNPGRTAGLPGDFRGSVRCLASPDCFKSNGFFYVYDIPVLETHGLGDLVARLVPRGLSFHLPDGTRDARSISADVWRTTREWRLRRLRETPDLPRTEYTMRAYLDYYARPHVTAAFLLLKDGLPTEAFRHVEAARDIDPGAEGLNRGLAAHFAETGWMELAERFAAREVIIAPASADNWMLYGNILLKLGRWGEAAGAYGRALRLDASSEEAVARLDMALAAQKGGAPEGWVRTRSAREYRELAEGFRKDDLGWLARESEAVADSGH